MTEVLATYCYDVAGNGDGPPAAPAEVDALIRYDRPTLELPDDLPFVDWVEVGARLKRAEARVMFLLGDWIRFGEQHYPDRYEQAIAATHYAYSTIQKAATVAKAIPPAARRESLPFAYHAEVAALPPPERDALLDRAERGEIANRFQLRAHARRATAAAGGKPLADPVCKRCGAPCEECALEEPAARGARGAGLE